MLTNLGFQTLENTSEDLEPKLVVARWEKRDQPSARARDDSLFGGRNGQQSHLILTEMVITMESLIGDLTWPRRMATMLTSS